MTSFSGTTGMFSGTHSLDGNVAGLRTWNLNLNPDLDLDHDLDLDLEKKGGMRCREGGLGNGARGRGTRALSPVDS